MTQEIPGRILAFEPGGEITVVRETFTAEQIINEEASIPRQDVTFNDIQESMIKATGNMLPDEIVEMMGFSSLRWQLLKKHNGLAGIFVGASNTSSDPIELQQALGVVEIRSQEDLVSKAQFYDPWALRKIVPGSIRTSGVVMDNAGNIRALGCLYRPNLSSSIKPATLVSVNVSISDEELLGYEHNNYDYEQLPSALYTGTYQTSALITKGQSEQTDNHRMSLRLHGSGGALWLEDKYSDTYSNSGWRLTKRDDHHYLSYTQSLKGKYVSDLESLNYSPTWELVLPAVLDK